MNASFKTTKQYLANIVVLFLLASPVCQAERIKDIAAVAGIRINQLVGYGLVVGLDGTGDQTSQTPFTVQSIKSMLAQYGVTVPPDVNPQLKNVAAVTVHADLPPFAKPGQQIDITVSSIGNAKSLRGGSLIMTPLRGADGQVYAIAQGNLVVGGLGVGGEDGSSITINVPSVGRIPNGATVERTVATQFASSPYLTLNLNTPDFTTATRLEQVINEAFKQEIAESIDAVSVRVKAPASMHDRVAFISYIESLSVTPGDAPAKVIVNSRTGTVVIGSHVRVTSAAVAHGSLTVTITSDPLVSQPPAFSGGQTAVVPRSNIEVKQGAGSRMFKVPAITTLDDVVRAVNQVGAAPGDLVAILEALKQAGALHAQIKVI